MLLEINMISQSGSPKRKSIEPHREKINMFHLSHHTFLKMQLIYIIGILTFNNLNYSLSTLCNHLY